MPKKLPYFPLYTGDWLKDPAVALCTPATRGIWIDLLCAMHESDRSGELCGTAEQLARIGRCSTVELALALTDIRTLRVAELTERNGNVCICNRRMRREYEKRKSNAERQMRLRSNSCRAPCNTEVSLSEDEIEDVFELFWKEYPKGRKNSKGTARDAFLKACSKAESATIIAAAIEYASSDVGRSKYVKMPSTWLNQECWLDDRQSWIDKDKPASESSYRPITSEEFADHLRMQRFKEKPTRNASNPNWVFGTLRDGTKVECKEYKKLQEDQG